MIFYALDLIGTFSFAISGATVTSKKDFDLFGITFLAFVTGIGGGSLRDLLLGNLPVSWLKDINYLLVILLGVLVSIVFKKVVFRLRKTLFLFDAIGIGICTIIGLKKALDIGIHPILACIMGLFSAVLGGVIRDTLCNEVPLIFKKEIYATACLIGALVYIVLRNFQIQDDFLNIITVSLIIAIRVISVKYNLSLPKYR
ncbi:trimeric intracellular cation channel family protein [Flavobacterium sp. MAHUQ-51]|uniref:trimeric intracellular cation channel family protein n=1 Tax=Flavobacterium sp. GCM10022190 TaxID=3252639 RepID=UPI0036189F7D